MVKIKLTEYDFFIKSHNLSKLKIILNIKIQNMDYKFYEELLDNVILIVYGKRITVDEKGIFEWTKNKDGSISHRSINKLHIFDEKKKSITNINSEPKVVYMTLKNSFYISKLSSENTFDIYSSGGGMSKRYTFKITNTQIEKLYEKVIMIR